MKDEGKTLILDALEAGLITSNTLGGVSSATFTRVDEDEGPMIVHLEGIGRYQVEVVREA